MRMSAMGRKRSFVITAHIERNGRGHCAAVFVCVRRMSSGSPRIWWKLVDADQQGVWRWWFADFVPAGASP